jgi:tRNA(fMet)-specific endonuclease VapC
VTLHLDTNVVIAILKDDPRGVRRRFREAVARGAEIAVSSLVAFELWYGVARSERQRENAGRLRTFFAGGIAVVHFGEDDAVQAGTLRSALQRAGTPIGPYDVLIAAQALTAGATLVTANKAEFARVRGLRVQNWGGRH